MRPVYKRQPDIEDRIITTQDNKGLLPGEGTVQVECSATSSPNNVHLADCLHADIDSLSNQMKAVSTLESSGSMRKSQRNWSAEHHGLKRSNANDAPLISRTTDKDDNVLLTLKGQRAMWQTINDRVIPSSCC